MIATEVMNLYKAINSAKDPYEIPDRIKQSVNEFGLGKCYMVIAYRVFASDDYALLDECQRTIVEDATANYCRNDQ